VLKCLGQYMVIGKASKKHAHCFSSMLVFVKHKIKFVFK
jgi:hypothetical protein